MIRIITLIIIMTVTIQICAAATVQNVGQFGWGPVKALEVDKQNKLLYIGAGATLWVYSIEDPENMTKISEISLGWRIYGMNLSGNYLYVANEKRVVIIDVSNPIQPKIIGEVTQNTSNYEAYDIAVYGSYAFVAAGNYGLQVLDVSDKTKPKEVTHLDLYGKKLKISGDYVYLLTHDYSDIYIIDIANPSNPVLKSTFTMPKGRPFDIKISNNIAYVTEYPWGIWAIDVSDPSNPKVLGNCTGSYYGEYESSGINVKDGYAFVSTWYRGLVVYDVSNPSNIKLICELPSTGFKGYLGEVEIFENLAFVAGHYSGVGIYNISDVQNGELIDKIPTVGRSFGLGVIGNYMLIGSDSGLLIVNVTDPSTPKLENTLKIGRTWGLIIDKNRNLAITHSMWYGPAIVDISDPTKPTILSRYTPNTGPIGIRDNYLYIINHITKELEIVDISNISQPKKISNVFIGSVWRGALYLNYTFITSANNGITIVNISNPYNPQIVSRVLEDKKGFIPRPVFSGNYMFAAAEGRVFVVDISDASNPVVVYESDPMSIQSLWIQGKYLIAGSKDSIKIFDISDPVNIKILGDFHVAHGPVVDVMADDRYIYTANDYWGAEIFSYSLEADTIPPKIENISIKSVTATSATIVWNTDEYSDSAVKYGTESGNYTYYMSDPTFKTTHSLTLTNLIPNTKYYFVIISKDMSGNNAQSEEYTFTTSIEEKPPLTEYTIKPTPQQGWLNTSATITFFRTDDVGVAYTNYSMVSEKGPWTKIEGEQPFSITISSEGETTIWYYSVDVNGSAEQVKSLTLKIDMTPPKIQNISVLSDVNSATISLNTDETTTCKIYYGTDPQHLSSVAECTAYSTNHTIPLNQLNPNTTYYFRVHVEDVAGNTNTSEVISLTTLTEIVPTPTPSPQPTPTPTPTPTATPTPSSGGSGGGGGSGYYGGGFGGGAPISPPMPAASSSADAGEEENKVKANESLEVKMPENITAGRNVSVEVKCPEPNGTLTIVFPEEWRMENVSLSAANLGELHIFVPDNITHGNYTLKFVYARGKDVITKTVTVRVAGSQQSAEPSQTSTHTSEEVLPAPETPAPTPTPQVTPSPENVPYKTPTPQTAEEGVEKMGMISRVTEAIISIIKAIVNAISNLFSL
ncbi:hypothetical protein GAH_00224 [Geoglobus ahangari]|uniref:Fibronectin type-III domain-containing protein n=1 Tax=Geoglobus ahangari TaxID=113653 RepID=A0A0F7IFW4_9EURY|nr:fibronectin type III domain-containing protein [Geoglobus ahangari]AKG92420.1 hypothetical protein GAH_00224 [Geoglobus ahangari]